MIEQKAIFEAAQTAFKANHPKFPWPKKHNLEDQTDEFKKAFLVFSTDINAMCDRDIKILVDEVNVFRSRLVDEINAGSTARENARVANRRADKVEKKLHSAVFSLSLALTVVAALGFALVMITLN